MDGVTVDWPTVVEVCFVVWHVVVTLTAAGSDIGVDDWIPVTTLQYSQITILFYINTLNYSKTCNQSLVNYTICTKSSVRVFASVCMHLWHMTTWRYIHNVYIHASPCTPVQVCVYVYIYMYVCVVYTCVYTDVLVCRYLNVCIHVYDNNMYALVRVL